MEERDRSIQTQLNDAKDEDFVVLGGRKQERNQERKIENLKCVGLNERIHQMALD